MRGEGEGRAAKTEQTGGEESALHGSQRDADLMDEPRAGKLAKEEAT